MVYKTLLKNLAYDRGCMHTSNVTKLVKIRIHRMQIRTEAFILSVRMFTSIK